MPSAAERVAIDTGPLISLGRAGALDLVQQLPVRFLAPQEVAEEFAVGRRAGHSLVLPPWVEVIALSAPLHPSARPTLGVGEAAVIQLAQEQDLRDVCIDERGGRRAAASSGLRVIGSLGLLGRAKHLGLVPEVRTWVDRLLAVGAYYDLGLVRTFLDAMGEPGSEDRR